MPLRFPRKNILLLAASDLAAMHALLHISDQHTALGIASILPRAAVERNTS